MIRAEGDRLIVAAAMTLASANALLHAGTAALSADAVFDLGGVSQVDSSGLAVVFGWLRAAQAQGMSIRIANPPANLLSLAQVYGVADLLPLA